MFKSDFTQKLHFTNKEIKPQRSKQIAQYHSTSLVVDEELRALCSVSSQCFPTIVHCLLPINY